MSVVALMRVTGIKLSGWATHVELSAIMTADTDEHAEEIKSFHAATPSANFTMNVKNEKAAEQFQPGYAFYVNLERAEQHDQSFAPAS